MSRFQFVADNSATFEVKRLCELVEIERSSYYAWKAGAPARAARAAADAALVEQIKKIHDEDKTCGAPRIAAELNDGVPAQERVNHKRVARVMRENSISGYTKKRRVRTTVPEPADQVVPDLPPGAGRRPGLVLRVLQPRAPAQLGRHDEPGQLREHRGSRPGSRIRKPSTIRGEPHP